MSDFTTALYKLIGAKIRTLRGNKQLNQEDLSDKVGVGRTSISNIELGRHQAPLHLLYKICQELDSDIHSVVPTFSEVRESMEKPESEIQEQLNKTNLPENSKRSIESYLQQIDTL